MQPLTVKSVGVVGSNYFNGLVDNVSAMLAVQMFAVFQGIRATKTTVLRKYIKLLKVKP